jgi:hypothetical protein
MEKEKRFAHGIGVAAGKIWTYLSQKGRASPSQLVRATGMPRDLVQRAIGWLAREDKLDFEKGKQGERVGLRESGAG